jgi:sigma-54 specific flagellar transcriptional regulator A
MSAQVHKLREEIRATQGAPTAEPLHPTGPSSAARQVRQQIAQVAPFATTVLVLGESGTGKEIVARQIHAMSSRAEGPFVPVNCGAIPAELLESELFGHERGAFTGAITARQGRFEIAQGGTLFLDEIGEMSPHMQVKLLRVLQGKCYERVGSSETRFADVRIIAATHRDLEADVREGRFREDLFFRLNVFPIQVPALRERTEDLEALIVSFHGQLAARGHQPVTFSETALAALSSYAWPGNIRELENLLERLSVASPGAHLEAGELPERYRVPAAPLGIEASATARTAITPELSAANPEVPAPEGNGLRVALPSSGLCLKSVLSEMERDLVKQALNRSDGVVSRAARLLNLGRTTLLEKMRKLQLS